LDAVKKDFARTVAEAQDELKMLQTQSASFEVRKPDINLGAIGAAIADGVKAEPKVDKGKGKEVIAGDEKVESGSSSTSLPTAKQTQAFFKNLQSTLATEANQINANLGSLQKTLSESIANNPSLAQINRANISTLSSTIQQNLEKAGTKINLRQAEKLAEDLLGEAGSFLKDAVKVVPPEEGSGSYTYSWDGTDVGVYGSAEDGNNNNNKSTVLFDRASMAGNDLSRSQLRLNALLRRLRTDVELLSQDPSSASETKARQDAFAAFKRDKIEGAGGYEGQDVQKLVWAEMGPEANDADVEALKKTKDALGE
jgi:hypothetical protein